MANRFLTPDLIAALALDIRKRAFTFRYFFDINAPEIRYDLMTSTDFQNLNLLKEARREYAEALERVKK